MIKYVCGFCFNEKLTHVLLIQKERPNWQKGKYNGIGGHIEVNESPIEAMAREFKEEAGILTNNWKGLATLYDKKFDCIIYFYYIVSEHIYNFAKTMTDEILIPYDINRNAENCISNLKWLLPLAIYIEKNPLESIDVNIC